MELLSLSQVLVLFSLLLKTTSTTAFEDISCNKTTRKCRCPEDPLTDNYADPSDPTCRNYFMCHLGRAFPRTCDVRMAFHPELRECMSRKRIPEHICHFPVECGLNGYIADPDDCTKYYLCFYQQPYHYGCTDGNVFEDKKKTCVPNKKKAETCAKPKFRSLDHDALRQ